MRYLLILLFASFVNTFTKINIYGTGLFLPYSMGVVGYIKKHIPLTDYKITGISGGAWCSLLYTLEDDLSNHDKIWSYTIGNNITKLKIQSDLKLFQKNVEDNLKLRYKTIEPINLDKISIISTKLDGALFKLKTEEKTNFTNIDDIIDFCLCSSYLPYLSGSTFSKKYKGNKYIDGDIKYDYKNEKIEKNKIIIHRHMWNRKFTSENYLYVDKDNSRKLFEYGWMDTEKNKEELISKIIY
tara:strand:- start:14169 stop:14891 length:723 start_codon:yes stop_codon:yes gene_type:complete